ncbi:TetR/AcrR family transcriptional regulator C-terminal domain-containing protein [Amycolatopsis sulphurea]|uniref:TetR/AcrR family transcriptional regulator C-terminal domain-containing protein n=1 Tax=Amycolatopsis sulphurea TaxID=76022 RepID=UPI000BF35BD0|nr:TetR/AcrR family transcriptional regulator C-terminal domain-containing protein [Amycolatopsis sulphurea]
MKVCEGALHGLRVCEGPLHRPWSGTPRGGRASRTPPPRAAGTPRLHAGATPQGEGLSRALHQLAFLVAAGLSEEDAQTAMLTTGHFTVGSVLEEQAGDSGGTPDEAGHPAPDPALVFDHGLALIIDGLARRTRSATARRR